VNSYFLEEVRKMTEIENPVITSRAASAIYLSLKALGKKGKVILPSTICLSPIMASKLAGYEIVFVGVHQFQMDLTSAAKMINSDSEIRAILIPQLYGYPIPAMDFFWGEIAHRDILVIEDLAQSWGRSRLSTLEGKPTLVTIHSFGEAKFFSKVRCGVLTTHDASFKREIDEVNAKIKFDDIKKFQQAGQNYRIAYSDFLRSTKELKLWQEFIDQAITVDPVLYIPKLPLPDFDYSISLNLSDRILEQNSRHFELMKLLASMPSMVLPDFETSEFPIWRSTVRVEPKYRDQIVRRLRAHSLPVSTWYRAMHKYTPVGWENSVKPDLSSAEVFENEVINFFIDESTPLSYADSVKLILAEVFE
jgi:dTDP-4-amino-4,6-dideoxygalactose transaminase